MEKASFVYKKANDLHVGINLRKTKRKVLHFFYETKLLSRSFSWDERFSTSESHSKKKTSYYMLDCFLSFYSVLHFTVVSRRLFSLVRGRISGNDDGERQRQRQKRPESHIRFRLAKQKLCTCITGRFLWYIFFAVVALPPNFTVFFWGRDHKTTIFFFFLWTYILSSPLEFNSRKKKSPTLE